MNNDDYRDINTIDDPDDFEEFDEYMPYSMQVPYWCPFNYMYRSPMPPPPPPFGGHGQPPFGEHGQPPFGGPGQPPFGGTQPGGPPTMPPPTFTPSQPHLQGQFGVHAVDPGALRPCRFRYVYLWLRNGRQFWAWLTFIGRNSVAGYRWNGRRWVYFGIDIRQIMSFVCR